CVTAQLTLLAVAYAWGGGRLVRAVLPAWAFLWLTIPRYGFDYWVRVALQQLASRCSGAVLDLTGVIHLPEGNVIAVAGRRLLVEEGCSGVRSLFVILAAVLFHLLWSRASVPRGLFLLSATVFWVLIVNIGRIVLVTTAATRWDVDLLGGWR